MKKNKLMQNLVSNYEKPAVKLQLHCWQATLQLASYIHTTGWGTWIRTKIDGVRVRCSTIKLFPNKPILPFLADSIV